MIRLEKHDELVEAIAEAMLQQCVMSKAVSKSFATAALDALLTAVVEKDVGGLVPVVKSINPERYGKQLVIELEEKPKT